MPGKLSSFSTRSARRSRPGIWRRWGWPARGRNPGLGRARKDRRQVAAISRDLAAPVSHTLGTGFYRKLGVSKAALPRRVRALGVCAGRRTLEPEPSAQAPSTQARVTAWRRGRAPDSSPCEGADSLHTVRGSPAIGQRVSKAHRLRRGRAKLETSLGRRSTSAPAVKRARPRGGCKARPIRGACQACGHVEFERQSPEAREGVKGPASPTPRTAAPSAAAAVTGVASGESKPPRPIRKARNFRRAGVRVRAGSVALRNSATFCRTSASARMARRRGGDYRPAAIVVESAGPALAIRPG